MTWWPILRYCYGNLRDMHGVQKQTCGQVAARHLVCTQIVSLARCILPAQDKHWRMTCMVEHEPRPIHSKETRVQWPCHGQTRSLGDTS